MFLQALAHRLLRRSPAPAPPATCPSCPAAAGDGTCPLGKVPAGCRVRVATTVDGPVSCEAADHTARLRDLGLCEGRSLRVLRNDLSGVIVAIDGGRLGLPADLAHRVLVQEP